MIVPDFTRVLRILLKSIYIFRSTSLTPHKDVDDVEGHAVLISVWATLYNLHFRKVNMVNKLYQFRKLKTTWKFSSYAITTLNICTTKIWNFNILREFYRMTATIFFLLSFIAVQVT